MVTAIMSMRLTCTTLIAPIGRDLGTVPLAEALRKQPAGSLISLNLSNNLIREEGYNILSAAGPFDRSFFSVVVVFNILHLSGMNALCLTNLNPDADPSPRVVVVCSALAGNTAHLTRLGLLHNVIKVDDLEKAKAIMCSDGRPGSDCCPFFGELAARRPSPGC